MLAMGWCIDRTKDGESMSQQRENEKMRKISQASQVHYSAKNVTETNTNIKCDCPAKTFETKLLITRPLRYVMSGMVIKLCLFFHKIVFLKDVNKILILYEPPFNFCLFYQSHKQAGYCKYSKGQICNPSRLFIYLLNTAMWMFLFLTYHNLIIFS